MSFAVSSHEKNGFYEVVLEDKTAGSQVVIHRENGASLYSFNIQTDDGTLNIVDNYPTPESLKDNLTKSFKSCKLSPFACRIPGGGYTHNNQFYQLQNLSPDGSSIHGLLYNKAFKITDEFYDENLASVQLSSPTINHQALPKYKPRLVSQLVLYGLFYEYMIQQYSAYQN